VVKKVGWEDESITGSWNDENERRFRGKKGTTFVIRVMTECDSFRRHEVDDVLDVGKDGEPRVFSMNCSREWDEDAQDYVGDCRGCDREYTLKDRYVAGILVVGKYVGRSEKVKRIDPDDAPHHWDFGGDKYRKLSDIALNLKRGKKKRRLVQVELVVSCEDESFQKLNILKADADHEQLTTKAHIAAWKEQGADLVALSCSPTPAKEWARRLKKKKPKRSRGGDDERDEKPRREARRPEPADEPDDRQESSGDEEIDDLLSELEE